MAQKQAYLFESKRRDKSVLIMKNQIDFQESYVNQPSEDVEDNFVFGNGRSYGVEFFVNKSMFCLYHESTFSLSQKKGLTISKS